ncbi:M48 family metalloprotease [Streptomyces sp. NPDC001828]|uniref:M48 family metalloprotease n=1 Tax=Streptomyces sp. NPDC001828 TaxID=3364615 RepID=UPI00368EA12C
MVRTNDWEQPADRHTRLVDPVITVRQLARFEFARKPLTRIDHALVFSMPKRGYDCYLPPLRPTRAETAAKRYTAMYEVDMGVHPVQAEFALPSDNDAFEFEVIVELRWQVEQPARFVASSHRDAPRLLLGELEQVARPVARRYPIADSARAEREILAAVTARGPLGVAAGLKALWTVRLRRDLMAAVERRCELRADEHAAALGFGPELAAVLTTMHTMDLDAGKAPTGPGVLAKLLSSHPDHPTRLRHLRAYTDVQR